ncbi:hypothetical protein ACWGCC_37915 [Streptomyces nigrescens]
MTGPEPQRGYTAWETTQLAILVGRLAAKGRPTRGIDRQIEAIKAKAVEREARQDAEREERARRK